MSQTTPVITLPALPLKSSVLFPRLLMPLAVGRPASVAAVEAALASEDKMLAVFAQKDPVVEEPTAQDLHRIGTLAVIKKMERAGEMVQIIVQGTQRVE